MSMRAVEERWPDSESDRNTAAPSDGIGNELSPLR